MTHPLLPTAYLPPVAYMAVVAQYPEVTIEQCETYPKQTVRNRATILTANGLQDIIVPVTRPSGNHTITHNIGIDHSRRWATTHLRTITAAYGASPYLFYYRDELERTLLTPYPTLLELNTSLLHMLLKMMKIECTVHLSSDFAPPSAHGLDMRHRFGPKHVHYTIPFEPYTQVFADRYAFCPNLSAIDLLCNLGPESGDYLRRIDISSIIEV